MYSQPQLYGVSQPYGATVPVAQSQSYGMQPYGFQQQTAPTQYSISQQSYGAPQQPMQQLGAPQQPAPSFGVPQQPAPSFGVPQQPMQQLGAPQQPMQQLGAPQQPMQQLGAPQGMMPSLNMSQQPMQQLGAPQGMMPSLNMSQGMMPSLNMSQGGNMFNAVPSLNTSQGGNMFNTSQGMMPPVQAGNPYARSSMVISFSNTAAPAPAPAPAPTTTTSTQLPISFTSVTSTSLFDEPKQREKFIIDSDMKRKASQIEVEFMQRLRSVLRGRLVQFVGISEDNVDVYLDDEIMIVWVRAFTHSTFSVYNYENLENLGDKLVGSIISKILHEIFGETMTPKTFSDISNYINSNVIFARFINAMDLYDLLRKDPDAILHETAIKGDLFESFCAALFLAGEHAMAKALEAPDRVNCAGFDLLYNLMQYCLLDIMQIVVIDNTSGKLTASDEILKASFGAPKSLLLQMFNVPKSAKDIDSAFRNTVRGDKNNLLTKIFDADPKCLNPNAVVEVNHALDEKDVFQSVFDKIFELDRNFFRKYRKYENADQIRMAIANDSLRRVQMETINAILNENGFEECVVQKETNKMKANMIFVRFTTKFTRTGRTLTIASALGDESIGSLILKMINHLAKDEYASLKRILSSNVF